MSNLTLRPIRASYATLTYANRKRLHGLALTRGAIFAVVGMTTFASATEAMASSLPVVQENCDPGATAAALPPPENVEPSPGGVDMQTGQFLYTHTDLSTSDDVGFALVRTFTPLEADGSRVPGDFLNLAHNWEFSLRQTRKQVCYATTPGEYDYFVSFEMGPRMKTFRAPYDYYDTSLDGFFEITGGEYSWLTVEQFTGGAPKRYTMHTADGSVYRFEPFANATISDKTARIETLTRANGEKYEFEYDTQLRRVISNRGFALGFDYATSGGISKACLVNLTLQQMPSTSSGGSACPAGAKTATYSYSNGNLVSFTDQSGVATMLDLEGTTQQIYRAGDTAPYLTNVLNSGAGQVTSQTFADGRTYSYTWTQSMGWGAPITQGKYTDKAGKSVTYKYGTYQREGDWTVYTTSGPTEVIDALNRKTTYVYNNCTGWYGCTPYRIDAVIDPLGNRREYTYGDYNNVTAVRQKPRSGSSLPDLVEYRAFDALCDKTKPACMAKPRTVTDPNGKATTYDYSYTHGGVTIETQPTVGVVIPKTETGYGLYYAWVSNGSGGYTKETDGIYLPSWTKECQTSAYNTSTDTCGAGSGDLIHTVFDYGADSGPRNLLLKGVTVTASGQTLRTCYQYDKWGNRIAETKPEAGLASCS